MAALPFTLITANEYVNRLKIKEDLEDIDVCECRQRAPDDDSAICNDQSCWNRMSHVECKRCAKSRCANQRMRQGKWAQLERFKTGTKKEYGLRTKQAIKKGDFVVEYVGEVINDDEFRVRLTEYQKCRHFYLLSLGKNPANNTVEYIDAFRKGCLARYINHSCDPNCTSEVWTVDGEKRVGVFALKDIAENEEITFDYQWSRVGVARVRCVCGSPLCQGFIGGSKDMSDDEFVLVKANILGLKDQILGLVFRVRRGGEESPWDVGELKSYDEGSEKYGFHSFLSHNIDYFELPDVALRMYAPDARVLDMMLQPDDKQSAVSIPRRFGADSRPDSTPHGDEAGSRAASVDPDLSSSPAPVVAVHELLPVMTMPSARRERDVSTPQDDLSASPEEGEDAKRAREEEEAQKQAQRESMRAQLQSEYLKRMDEEARERAEAEALAEAERAREAAARQAEAQAEYDRLEQARQLTEELRRLEQDVALLPPKAPKPPEAATKPSRHSSLPPPGSNGSSRDGKKRTSEGKPIAMKQLPATPVPLVKEKQKLYAKSDEIGRQGLLFPFLSSWKCSHAEAYRHSASIRAGVFEGDEWLERRCVAAIIRRACDALHLESVVIARALLLAARFYESYPVRTEIARIDAVAACAVLLAQKSEAVRKGLSDIVRVVKHAMGFSPPVRAFEPHLAASPSFPSGSAPQLEASHVLAIQPLMVTHLRFDLTPTDPMIALEKALKRSLTRRLGGGGGLATLSDAENAFMSRVSGLSMEPPARRHKDMAAASGDKKSRARKGDDDSSSDSESDSDDDGGKTKHEPVFKTPVGQAAVALLFRSLEWTPQLWLCWDNDVMAYALVHCVAAYSAAFSDGARRSWFKLGVEPRVDVVKFGPSVAQLHDAVHDLMSPPPVFLRPEMSDFLQDSVLVATALRAELDWLGLTVPGPAIPLFPFKRRYHFTFEKSPIPYRIADPRSLPRSVGAYKIVAQVTPDCFVGEEIGSKRLVMLQQWPLTSSVKASAEGFSLTCTKTVKTLQDLHLPKPSDDAGEDTKGKKASKKKHKKKKKAGHKDGGKDKELDPRRIVTDGLPLAHVPRSPNVLLPLEIVVGTEALPLPHSLHTTYGNLSEDVQSALAETLKGNFIVYEYAKHDVLGLVYESLRVGSMPLSYQQRVGFQLAQSVRRAHSRGVVIQGLNPSHVWLSVDGVVRLHMPEWQRPVSSSIEASLAPLWSLSGDDFGKQLHRACSANRALGAIQKTVSAGHPVIASLCSAETLPFVAPEVLLGLAAPVPANDLWSLGCCLYFLHTGRCLFPGTTPGEVLAGISAVMGRLSDVWPAAPGLPGHALCASLPVVTSPWPSMLEEIARSVCPDLATLIDSLLQLDPSRRPTAKHALTHSYFKDFVPTGVSVSQLQADLPPLRMQLPADKLHPLFQPKVAAVPVAQAEGAAEGIDDPTPSKRTKM